MQNRELTGEWPKVREAKCLFAYLQIPKVLRTFVLPKSTKKYWVLSGSHIEKIVDSIPAVGCLSHQRRHLTEVGIHCGG